MKLLSDFNTIVIVGLWNRYIFNPEWAAKYLFPDIKLNVEVPLNVEGSHRISTDKVRISVVANKLNLTPILSNTEVFDYTQELAFKVADYLPHTPVTAYGVNFIFESQLDELGFDVFNLPDVNFYRQKGLNLQGTSYKHTMIVEDAKLNLSVSNNGSSIRFDFNFHYDIPNLIEFKDQLSKHPITKLQKLSEELLKDLYFKRD